MELIVAILGFCAIITLVAFKSSFFGLKLMAGAAWFGFFIYWINNPPDGITTGDTTHTAISVIAIGFALMIVLAGMGRGIQRSQKWNDNSETTTNEFKLKLPDWLKGNTPQPGQRNSETRQQRLSEYEARWDNALGLNKRNKR